MLDNDDAICMETIQAKLDEYSSIAEFKHDLQLAFHTVLPKLANHSPQRREALDKLHEFAMATLRFESQRLLKRKSHEREGQDQMVMDTFDDQQQQVALFRPTMDGFVFTDAVPSAFLDRKERLPGGVQEMAIYPTPSTAEVPSLRNTVPPPPRFPSRIHRHEDKHTVPIQWLDYGVFSSFAPTRDSNHANISYEHTYMGRVAKRFKRWEKKQRNLQTLGKPTSPPKSVAMKNGVSKDDSNTTTTENNDNKDEIDTQWLKEQGLDVDAILDAAQSGSVNVDDLIGNDEKDIEGVLERNSELLSYLSQYQEYRFGLGDARWGSIDETERNIAKALEKRMHKLASKVAPKDLTESEAVEAAMDRLPLREPAYRGSLPPNKPFAYPTNEQVEPIPPLANLLPGYPKERWKLVDVAPVPNKEKQHYHPQQQQQKRPPHPHPSASSSSSSSSPSPYRPSPS
ncbi:hypothetical protein BDB00DRAFT_792477 [Zychaea mexicana]|uniref:uncharacterized protein n=1 Tax=Zychaea mexicana TaxID=64656 RepID=UPI0022FE7376|nr:uncharacterized protein BDB00DRAFT_792477 [Zychaea mexicana]KAI9484974.1 hypothetical protein BDB00DRAFT_792477 [Zychaea mexicana]